MSQTDFTEFHRAVQARIALRQLNEQQARDTKLLQDRAWLETRPSIVSALIIIARMSVGLKGFPANLRGARDSYLTFWINEKDGDMWRLFPDSQGISKLFMQDLPKISPRFVASEYCLPSSGMDFSPEAVDILAETAEWAAKPIGIMEQLIEIIPLLPRHVLAASLANGSQVLETVGIEPTSANASAWIRACCCGDIKLAEQIGDATQTGDVFVFPLHAVARDGDMLFLDGMLNAEANKNLKDPQGATPLMLAVQALQIPVCDRLLEALADIYATDYVGNNALHYLATGAFSTDVDAIRHIANALVDGGLDPTAKNKNGETPAELFTNMFGVISARDTERSLRASVIMDLLSGRGRPLSGNHMRFSGS